MTATFSRLGTFLTLIVLAGCGPDGPEIVTVAGKVTYKGEPVPGLTIQFQPEKGRPSNARTDDQGNFELDYDAETKGAVVGKHTVSAIFLASGADEEFGKGKRHAAIGPIVQKYGSSTDSPCKIEITKATKDLVVALD